jgi:hypothetical protein
MPGMKQFTSNLLSNPATVTCSIVCVRHIIA